MTEADLEGVQVRVASLVAEREELEMLVEDGHLAQDYHEYELFQSMLKQGDADSE